MRVPKSHVDGRQSDPYQALRPQQPESASELLLVREHEGRFGHDAARRPMGVSHRYPDGANFHTLDMGHRISLLSQRWRRMSSLFLYGARLNMHCT